MKIGILNVILIAVIAASAGIAGGRLTEIGYRKPLEIKNGCAYYDMDNGNFTWGMKPIVVGMNKESELQPDPSITLTPVHLKPDMAKPLPVGAPPKHKPRVPKPEPTINQLSGDEPRGGAYVVPQDAPKP